jgi:hypothetical protein
MKTSRLTAVWALLSAITLLSWGLGRTAQGSASAPVTIGILVIGLVKTRLVLRTFMEVDSAPGWLRRATDGWLFAFWGAVLAIYLF